MKILLSPAMTIEIHETNILDKTMPIFKKEIITIVEYIKTLTLKEISHNFKVNEKIAQKVYNFYKEFDTNNFSKKSCQSIIAFNGLVFKNIGMTDFLVDDYQYISKNIYILSGLYGILRSTDLIQEYRLDFLSPIGKNIFDTDLYNFWNKKIYDEIFKTDELVLGLCSQEYEKMFLPYLKDFDKYISCKFLINKNGVLKNQATLSKIARGKMTRIIIKNKINNIEELKKISFDGFRYSNELSDSKTLVFIQ